jgi:hypothetical protein
MATMSRSTPAAPAPVPMGRGAYDTTDIIKPWNDDDK